jgi:hypothetical protein
MAIRSRSKGPQTRGCKNHPRNRFPRNVTMLPAKIA